MLSNLKEELQQQNQALIADISRLLEGFASMVGRVVKEELETVVTGLKSSASVSSSSVKPANTSQSLKPTNMNQALQQPMVNDKGSTRTWSKVHQEGPTSQDLSSGDGPITVENLIKKATAKTKKANMEKEKQKQKQQQIISKAASTKSVSGSVSAKSQPSKQQTSNEGVKDQSCKQKTTTSDASELSTLFAGIQTEDSVSSSKHFFPEDGPANMLTFDIPKVAESGKVCKSPVYYLQDQPCKVQLSLWFDAQKKMNMSATVWGLSCQFVKPARLFTFSGSIKNLASKGYSPLFQGESNPFKLKHSSSLSVKLNLSLITGTGAYDVDLETLQTRNYILSNKDAISINWIVTTREVETQSA